MKSEPRHSFACLGLCLDPDSFRNAEQERTGACRRVEDCDARIAQTFGRQIIADGSIKRTNDVLNDFQWSVVNSVPFSRFGIERLQEIFIKEEDRIASVSLDGKNFRREAVNRVAQNLEPDAKVVHDLIQA
jgi:hypothetical protein